MPKQINTPYPGAELVRTFSLKGRFQPVLDETIVPVVLVGDVEQDQVVRRAWGGQILAASGAGNQNKVLVINPVGSPVQMIIRRWNGISGTPATDKLALNVVRSSGGSGSAGKWRDSALPGVPYGQFTGFAAGAVVLFTPTFTLRDENTLWNTEIVINPGHHLECIQNAPNTTLELTFEWDEVNLSF